MLKNFKFDINGYGTVKLFQGEIGRIANVWVKSEIPVIITIIVDGYKEIITDYLTNNYFVRIPVNTNVKTKNIRVVVKAYNQVATTVNLSFAYA